MKFFAALAATAGLIWAGAAPALAAPAPPANVNFAAAQGQPFSLVLDGRAMTNPVARQVHIGQLMPGRHWADFSLTTAYGQPLNFHTSVWLEPGLETSYVLVVSSYGPQLQRVSAVAIGSPVYGGPGQNGGYNNGYQLPAPAQSQPGTYAGPPDVAPPANGGYDNGYQLPTQPQPQSQPGTYAGPPTNGSYPQPAPDGGDPNGSYSGPPAPASPGAYDPTQAPAPAEPAPAPDAATGSSLPPLPADEVETLTQELHDYPSDNARLTAAKQALARASVRAEDLAQLLSTFSLDKSRIALAEYGYEHVSDPENFNAVYEAFHLPASVREVQRALGLPAQ